MVWLGGPVKKDNIKNRSQKKESSKKGGRTGMSEKQFKWIKNRNKRQRGKTATKQGGVKGKGKLCFETMKIIGGRYSALKNLGGAQDARKKKHKRGVERRMRATGGGKSEKKIHKHSNPEGGGQGETTIPSGWVIHF